MATLPLPTQISTSGGGDGEGEHSGISPPNPSHFAVVCSCGVPGLTFRYVLLRHSNKSLTCNDFLPYQASCQIACAPPKKAKTGIDFVALFGFPTLYTLY